MYRVVLTLFLFTLCSINCVVYDESGDSEKEERLIIIGGIGAGKSTTGNIILGRKAFDANTMSDRVTKEPATESATRFGRKIFVVDTPGFDISNRIFNEKILREITLHCSLGYKAIILVLRIQEFELNEKIVTFLNDVLPKDAFEHLIIIFSNIAALEKNDETIEGNLKNYPDSSSLKRLLLQTNRRYVGLQYYSEINRESTGKITSDILTLIDTLPKTPLCLCFSICAMEQLVIPKEDKQLSSIDRKLIHMELKLEKVYFLAQCLITLLSILLFVFLLLGICNCFNGVRRKPKQQNKEE